MHLSTSRAFVRSTLLTGLVLAPILAFGCSSERKLPESTGNSTDALAWKKILIRVPAERMGEFEEGGGLIQQVEPVDAVNGESGWWLARFPVVDIPVLEADGFEVRTLEAGLVNPQAQDGDACPVTYPVQEAFCGYHGGSLYSNCKRPIWNELGDAPTDFPPINGNTYVSVVDFPNVPEELRGVRIGKHSTSSTPVPQMVVFAAQHGNEWAGTEMSMRLFRFLAQSFRDDTNGVRSLLANVSILIIPVAIPRAISSRTPSRINACGARTASHAVVDSART